MSFCHQPGSIATRAEKSDTFADRLGHLDEGHFKGCEWSYCWMHFGPSSKRDFPYGSRPCAHARLGVQAAFNGR